MLVQPKTEEINKYKPNNKKEQLDIPSNKN